MLHAAPQFSPQEQTTLCQRFLAAKVDWPDFERVSGKPLRIHDLTFFDLLRNEEHLGDWARRSLAIDDSPDKHKLVSSILSTRDGKLFSLSRVVLHFDMQDIIRKIYDLHDEMRDDPNISSEILSPSNPAGVIDHAAGLCKIAALGSTVEDARDLLERSRDLYDAFRDVKKMRFVSPLIEKRAEGGRWGEIDVSLVDKHMEPALAGVVKLAAYLEKYHCEKSVDLLAGSMWDSQTSRQAEAEHSVLDGTFSRHIEAAHLALDNLAHGLSIFHARLSFENLSKPEVKPSSPNGLDNGAFDRFRGQY